VRFRLRLKGPVWVLVFPHENLPGESSELSEPTLHHDIFHIFLNRCGKSLIIFLPDIALDRDLYQLNSNSFTLSDGFSARGKLAFAGNPTSWHDDPDISNQRGILHADHSFQRPYRTSSLGRTISASRSHRVLRAPDNSASAPPSRPLSNRRTVMTSRARLGMESLLRC